MKRLDLPKINSNPSFIGSWTMENPQICDEIIDYFELNKTKQVKGVSLGGNDPKVKDTIDIIIRPKDILLGQNQIFQKYFHLQKQFSIVTLIVVMLITFF